jgi:plastocyanin
VRGRSTVRFVAAIALAAAAALAPVPASGKEAKPEPAARVTVNDNFFSPRAVTVEVGDVVRWIWRGDNGHNVAFKRVPRGAGKRGASWRKRGHWQRKFRKAGRYRYVCTFFAGMRGSITVEEPKTEPSSDPSAADAF